MKGETLKMRRGLLVGALLVAATLAGCSFLGGGDAPPFTNWEPELSPDGRRLVYESADDGSLDLYTLELETEVVERLTENDVDDWSPSWSADGTQIAFASNRDKNVDIYILVVETREARRLTTDEGDDINPSWANDGRIYFNSNRTGMWEIFAIDPDGENLTKLTDTPAAE